MGEWESFFSSRTEPDPETGCILWVKCRDKGGYGLANNRLAPGETRTHRMSWIMRNGPIPEGMKVLHKCDVRNCVNPDHLFIGTQADNVADMMRKGRNRNVGVIGAKNPQARLTEDDIWSIRWMARLRLFSQAQIASDYGVSPMTISRAVNEQTWSHVPW